MKWISNDVQEGWRTRRGFRGRWLTVYLHRYSGKAESTERFHNHPWRLALSIILSGGFVEDIFQKRWGTYLSKYRHAPSIWDYWPEHTHRVRDVRPGTLSLFIGLCRIQDTQPSYTEKAPEGAMHYTEQSGEIAAR